MRFRLGFVVSFCLLASALPAQSQPAGSLDADPADLVDFADAFFAGLNRFGAPGAVLVVVRDGQVVLARGYGYADLELRRPIDPDQTVFRVASISKLFIATAVMQLVEQGQVDLHTDVNTYLRLPETYPEPITLAALLTHTSGLDERLIGMATRRPADVIPVADYLAARLPPRVYPPGKLIRYSNDGMALAALVVEDITGRPFAAYAREKIFGPLAMDRTGYDPAPGLAVEPAAGYEYRGGTFWRVPPDYFNVGPAASLLTTGTDLARFMVAMLEGGRYGDARILAEDSVREMQRRQFSHHPRLPGWTLGFFEYIAGGRRALAHDGDWRGFASLMFLLPEAGTGLFVANNGHSHRFNWEFLRQFLDRYYPPRAELPPEAGAFPDDPGRFAGSYRTVRYGRGTVEKLVTLVEQFRVTVSADGRLWLRLLFRRADADGYLAFREDGTGRVTHLFLGGDRLVPSPLALERVPWPETTGVQLVLVAGFVAVFGAAFVWLVVHHRLKDLDLFDLTAFLVGGLNLGALGGLAIGLFAVDRYEFAYGIPPGLLVTLHLPVLSTALMPLLGLLAAWSWLRRAGSTAGRGWHLAVVLASGLFVWFAATWNLPPFAKP